MTTPKMTLKNDNQTDTKAKKEPEYPKWPGRDKAELGVKYINPRGNLIQLGESK
jgi:hypothetical protein